MAACKAQRFMFNFAGSVDFVKEPLLDPPGSEGPGSVSGRKLYYSIALTMSIAQMKSMILFSGT